MKTNIKGYRISRNGSLILSIEKEAIQENMYLGHTIKENGTYYFFSRKQGETYVYLP